MTASVDRDTRWWELARCRDRAPELMHPLARNHIGIVVAKRICAACPVSEQCLKEALDIEDVEGVRGGLTGEERAQMLAERLPSGACPECRRTDLRITDGRLGRHWAPGTSPGDRDSHCRGSGAAA